MTTRSTSPALPDVNFSDHGDRRYLHLGTEWVQGSMRLDAPYEIDLDYVQRMMAWLLFVDPASVSTRHAMQLGLGAGALTKFCRRKLRMRTTAIELNPQVVAACRLWFKLPADDERLSVILGDAADVAASAHWRGRIDALQVDLYDHEAAAPVLDSEAFYADCRRLLTGVGLQADPRGQHRGLRAAHALHAHPRRTGRARGHHRVALGTPGRQVAARTSTPRVIP